MEKIEYHLIESYAVFKNLDQSILKLNPIINPFGYTFQAVGLNDLEKRFGDLFHLPENFHPRSVVSFEGTDLEMSYEFYQLLSGSIWGSEVTLDGQIFMLRKIQDFEQEIVDKRED